MTVVGLHPEELFDKLLQGELTPADRERLRQHLQACEVCRFEYAARADFQREALERMPSVPPPLSPFAASRASAPIARRRWSRPRVLALAAAALLTATGAVAAGVTGQAPWRALTRVFWRSRAPGSDAASVSTAPKGSTCVGTSCNGSAASRVQLAPSSALSAREPVPAVAASAPPAPAAARVARRSSRPSEQASVSSQPAARLVAASAAVVQETLTAARLFADGNSARRAGDVGRASSLYHRLQQQFPGSEEAELSRVTLSLLLLDSGDARGALSGFERYLAGPSRGLEAEALVGRARALGRLGRRELEASAWQEVQRKYPRSIYGRQASERLASLGQP